MYTLQDILWNTENLNVIKEKKEENSARLKKSKKGYNCK
jgi:hypothetical protein